MNINAIHNTTFGNINIHRNSADELTKKILTSSEPAEVYRQALADVVQLFNYDEYTLHVDKFLNKETGAKECKAMLINEISGSSNFGYSPYGLFGDFLLSLKKSRSPEYNNLLRSLADMNN